jgi:hypothetical protein
MTTVNLAYIGLDLTNIFCPFIYEIRYTIYVQSGQMMHDHALGAQILLLKHPVCSHQIERSGTPPPPPNSGARRPNSTPPADGIPRRPALAQF